MTSACTSDSVIIEGITEGRTLEGVRPAYDQMLLEDGMTVLAEFFDYAVNDCGAEGDEVADLFCLSSLSVAFAHGDPRYVGGMSGAELFLLLNRECGGGEDAVIMPEYRFEKTPEYWVGWTAAYVQWRFDMSFDRVFSTIPYDEFIGLYRSAHEASEEWFAHLFVRRLRDAWAPTNLSVFRKRLGLSQRELAHRSGVSLRSIQMYEQRRKDINKAQAYALYGLARALHVSMEDLLEPCILPDWHGPV